MITNTDADTLFRRICDYSNRADPYPLYAELRQHGVARQDDGSFLVGTYHEIAALLHDPRISSDRSRRTDLDASPIETEDIPVAFIGRDDPEHERLRRIAMRPFGPPHSPCRVAAMQGDIEAIVGGLIDALRGRDRIDLVDDFAYPLPVNVICRLLGVPPADEPQFRAWSETVIGGCPEPIRHNASATPWRPGWPWASTWATSPTVGGASLTAVCCPPSSTITAPKALSPVPS
jgi:cytochrome P450